MVIERETNIAGLGIDKGHCWHFDVQDFNITTGP